MPSLVWSRWSDIWGSQIEHPMWCFWTALAGLLLPLPYPGFFFLVSVKSKSLQVSTAPASLVAMSVKRGAYTLATGPCHVQPSSDLGVRGEEDEGKYFIDLLVFWVFNWFRYFNDDIPKEPLMNSNVWKTTYWWSSLNVYFPWWSEQNSRNLLSCYNSRVLEDIRPRLRCGIESTAC